MQPIVEGGLISLQTHPSSIDISMTKREQLARGLTRQLAALKDLHSQVKQAHWNIRGPFFYARHELFDAIASRLLTMVDDMAERIGTLGFYAYGTTRMVSRQTYLEPYDLGRLSGHDHIKALVVRFRQVEQEFRDLIPYCDTNLGDPVTADLLIGMLRILEKDLWFLESHLEPGPLAELRSVVSPKEPDDSVAAPADLPLSMPASVVGQS